ncbi:MAG TPA: DUF3455 domain-containing protein [Usitatibacter sp.]|nr:DUF3455 domain-containing protein [Usitatibacter sp.]
MSLQKNRLFVAFSAAALVASLCLIPLVTLAADDRVPEALRPAAGEELAFVLAANGVQVYSCKPSAKDPYSYAWSFVAPEAMLAENGSIVGRHFAGPTWASGSDLSSVKGTVRERHDGGPGNIPWLLLTGTSTSTPGRFANVTSVQRLATQGGVEPTEACSATNVGKEVRVPYTVDYYFYKRKTSGIRFDYFPYMG